MAGPELEELHEHVLAMYKAMVQDLEEHVGMTNSLTFLKSDFKPSKADPDIWMRSSTDGTHYEYIAVYVDDLAMHGRSTSLL